MSDDFDPIYDESDEMEEAEFEEEEYEEIEEEISSVEVDRVLETVSKLMEQVESETVHGYLEDAYNQIFSLIYEEEDGEVSADDDGEAGHYGDEAEAA